MHSVESPNEMKRESSGDHPNYSIIKIGQNTEKCPGDLWRLAATQTPVEDHRQLLAWKTPKGVKIDNDTHKLIWDFEMHTDYLIPARRPDLIIIIMPCRHFSLWQVYWATSRIITELLYVCSSWPSCFCSAICGDP